MQRLSECPPNDNKAIGMDVDHMMEMCLSCGPNSVLSLHELRLGHSMASDENRTSCFNRFLLKDNS